jgi:ABC-type bacteriocin/lantibiotic exporter with double-glycine peptidase domain
VRGETWSVEELRRDVKMSAKGAKLGALRDAARARGFEAYAIAGNHEDLRRELEKGRPVMLGLQLPFEQNRALHHYEVVVAMNPRDGTVVTLDPATGKYLQRTKAVLEKEWKPVGYPTLVVVGPRVARN